MAGFYGARTRQYVEVFRRAFICAAAGRAVYRVFRCSLGVAALVRRAARASGSRARIFVARPALARR